MSRERGKQTRAVTEEAIVERRREILAQASRIISLTGVDGCSFGAVSDATGFSIGMIQHYFRTRERLILATVEYTTDVAVREWNHIASQGADALERINDLLTFAVEGEVTFEEAWGFWIEVYAAARKDEIIRKTVAQALLAWRAIFLDAIREAFDENLIISTYDADELTTVLLAVIDGLAFQSINGIYNAGPSQMIQTLQRFAAHEFSIDVNEFVKRNRTIPPMGRHRIDTGLRTY